MARANRHHIPGQVWHIIHRCHKQEFLLKFSRDRRRWLHWLFEAKKRYGLQILNYVVTSNHIHIHLLIMAQKNYHKFVTAILGQEQEYKSPLDNRTNSAILLTPVELRSNV